MGWFASEVHLEVCPTITTTSIQLLTNLRTEAWTLSTPVVQRGEGGHHEEGTRDPHLHQVAEQCEALHSLAQAHLIRQQAIDTILVHHLTKAMLNEDNSSLL